MADEGTSFSGNLSIGLNEIGTAQVSYGTPQDDWVVLFCDDGFCRFGRWNGSGWYSHAGFPITPVRWLNLDGSGYLASVD
jgi:hypothetical protein